MLRQIRTILFRVWWLGMVAGTLWSISPKPMLAQAEGEASQVVGARVDQVVELFSRSELLLAANQRAEALAAADQAVALAESPGESPLLGLALMQQGWCLYFNDQRDRAAQVLERAATLLTGDDLRRFRARASLYLGVVQQANNELDSAERAFLQALELARGAQDAGEEANVLMSLGDLYVRQDRLPEAEARYEDALRLFRDPVKDKLGEANVLKSLGDLYVRQDRLPEAEARYEDALRLFRDPVKDKLGEANVLKSLGDLYVRQDRLPEAEARYEDALRLFQKDVGEKRGAANVLKSLALLRRMQNRPKEAWEHAQSAMEVWLSIQSAQASATALSEQSAATAGFADDLILLAVDLGHVREAWTFSQLLHGQALVWERQRAGALVSSPTSHPGTSNLQQLQKDMRTSQQAEAQSMSRLLLPNTDRRKELGTLNQLRAEQGLMELRLAQALGLGLPGLKTLDDQLSRIQDQVKAAPEAPLLLEYYLRNDVLVAFVIGPEKVCALPLLRTDGGPVWPDPRLRCPLLDKVESLAEHVGPHPTNGKEVGKAISDVFSALYSYSTAHGAPPTFPLASAEGLYNLLVRPFEPLLQCQEAGGLTTCQRPLWIVPDGALFWLPFPALVARYTSDDPLEADYLGQRARSSILPSSRLLLPELQVPRAEGGLALTMGTPLGSGLGDEEKNEGDAAHEAWAKRCKAVGCTAERAEGRQAREAVLHARLQRLRFLHLSSHGLYVRANNALNISDAEFQPLTFNALALSEASGLFAGDKKGLSKGGRTTKGIDLATLFAQRKAGSVSPSACGDPSCDGLVLNPELLGQAPNLEVAILSTCVGGLGNFNLTEGFTGIARTLVAQGTNLVIAASWPVDVDSTSLLMQKLYQPALWEGKSWDEAMRFARQQVYKARPAWRHPYYWAGFQQYGVGLPRPVLPPATAGAAVKAP